MSHKKRHVFGMQYQHQHYELYWTRASKLEWLVAQAAGGTSTKSVMLYLLDHTN
jgi:hypothetical protein